MLRIPSIIINGQTTALYGDQLSDFTFIIQDDQRYNKAQPCKRKCDNDVINESKAKTTEFFEFQPPLLCVVKGKSKILRKKVLKLYYKYQPETGLSFNTFYDNLIFYGMLKYFLGRLMYGQFDINILCRNYNKQFLKDLKKSRFCYYYNYLLDPINGLVGYDRYFVKCGAENKF